jgi:acetone carboxylase gamma subunit
MKYPIGENLEVVDEGQGRRWVQCAQCEAHLAPSPTAWREAARIRVLPAKAASPLMAILDAQYHLEQLLCPSCGALFDTELVEEQPGERVEKA